MSEHTFSIEFQPIGIRVIYSEPVTVLEAARQAGITLRSDCGGKGSCGKCAVQIVEGSSSPLTRNETIFRKGGMLQQNERLACETILDENAKIYIPSGSFSAAQVLQTEGILKPVDVHSPIRVEFLSMTPPTLAAPKSDLENILEAKPGLYFENDDQALFTLRKISPQIRKQGWKAYAICSQNRILTVCIEEPARLLGLAVDIGSTKIACYLMDLTSGNTLAAKGVPNPQIAYGEDIIARLSYAMQGAEQEERLHSDLIRAINQAAEELVKTTGAQAEEIADFCMVGNTAMHHFFLHLPTRQLATSPFTPAIKKETLISAETIGVKGLPGSRIVVPGPIAGFVGSDHLAFLLASSFGEDGAVRLGIDIGTNTEIALQKGKRIISCSTASGPAFEGAHIRFGMRASRGAIEHVAIDQNGKARCKVIGDGEATGICGSGILDAISEMKRSGILNQRGRLDAENPSVAKDGEGVRFYRLLSASDGQREITLSQKDIDQILLAKGAIRSGIAILMDTLQVAAQEIEEVLIAGAFGSYLNPYHAIQIGMLPSVDLGKIKAVGNAAGAGARLMLLSEEMRQKASALAQRIEHLELNTYPDFELFFANGIRL